MDKYDEISYLLHKYSSKQPNEKWSKESNKKYRNMKLLEEQIHTFESINGEYFRLVGTQVDRAIYLIKRLNFNEVCPRCSNEQMIVLICYYVKCEYIPNYERRRCKRAFEDYNVPSNLLDKFMVYLARVNVEKTFGDFNVYY